LNLFELKIKKITLVCVLCSCLSLQSDSFNVQVLKAKNVALKALFAKEYYNYLLLLAAAAAAAA
jgi:hypothetical protein